MPWSGSFAGCRCATWWRHEALDFSRWLEEEIDVLGEAIGIDLTAAERERSAGDFSVDLIAEDDAGRLVVIENQLERSHHDHVGKPITYRSVLEAGVAVWIAGTPRPEHVVAVTWLNESRGTEFYLLKAEAVAIGDSDPAPLVSLCRVGREQVRHTANTTKCGSSTVRTGQPDHLGRHRAVDVPQPLPLLGAGGYARNGTDADLGAFALAQGFSPLTQPGVDWRDTPNSTGA